MVESSVSDFRDVNMLGRELVAIPTPGHSPGHVCFFDRATRLFFSGDHILPRITPHIGYHLDGPSNPLGDFLRSCDGLRGLDPVSTLPGHEWVFNGLDHRLDELIEHHRLRLDVIAEHVDDGADTVWAIAERMGWLEGSARTSHMALVALAEVWAHLIVLETNARVDRLDTEDGPFRWRSLPRGASIRTGL
jgi:glyoxylase-like metal-dependent hydrolase (beta-lactamase superfamily II)